MVPPSVYVGASGAPHFCSFCFLYHAMGMSYVSEKMDSNNTFYMIYMIYVYFVDDVKCYFLVCDKCQSRT